VIHNEDIELFQPKHSGIDIEVRHVQFVRKMDVPVTAGNRDWFDWNRDHYRRTRYLFGCCGHADGDDERNYSDPNGRPYDEVSCHQVCAPTPVHQ
jgi:hypothetical protein